MNNSVALRNCFQRLKEYNLKLSIDKSTFGAEEMEYLGFKITLEGILPGTDKTRAVKSFHPQGPLNKSDNSLDQFLPRSHQGFLRISGYLTSLTRKSSDWKGGDLPEQSLTAFLRLQHLLVHKPVIAYDMNDLPFKLYCDASMGTVEKSGNKISGWLGAVLTQLHEDGKE